MSSTDNMETTVMPPVDDNPPTVNPQGDDNQPGRKPTSKWVKPTAIASAVVLVLAIGGGLVAWRHHTGEQTRQQALTACQDAVNAANSAKDLFAQAQTDVQEVSQITADQVSDASLVDSLKNLTTPTDVVPACDVNADKTTLDSTVSQANAVKTTYETAATTLKDTADKVTASRDQKTLDTAKTQLTQAKTDGQNLYDQSAGKVQDENTRAALKTALDSAKDDTADNANASMQAIRTAMDQVNASVQAKTDADNAAAQATAQADAAQNNNNGSSAKNSGGSSSTTKKNSGSSSSSSSKKNSSNSGNSGSASRKNNTGNGGSSSNKNNGGSSNNGSSSNSGNSGGAKCPAGQTYDPTYDGCWTSGGATWENGICQGNCASDEWANPEYIYGSLMQ